MNYFNKIFSQYKQGETDILSRNYPYSLKNMRKRIDADKQKFATIKESIEDVTIKTACDMKLESLGDGQMGSSLLSGFIPDIFTDSIVQFGTRQAVARRDFPVISQSSNSSFKHRYIWRHDSAGIYREGDEILSAITKRLVDEFSFCKLADSMVYSRELLEDSPISQVSLDTSMAANKLSMLEDRLMWHELTYISDENLSSEWTPYNVVNLGCDSSNPTPTFSMISSAVAEAMLNLTTRQEDNVSQDSLRLYVSPDVYRILWNDDSYRRFDILGASPVQVTGQVPPLYRIPTTVITPGYFDTSNNWQYQKYDMYLVSTGCAAIRQRADLRMEPLGIQHRQMEGWLMSERIRPYVIQPINFVRISCDPATLIKPIEEILWKPRDLSKTEGTLEMTSIQTS